MSEFAKCKSETCPCRRQCLRYTAPANPSTEFQEYGIYSHGSSDRCSDFMPDPLHPTKGADVEMMFRRFVPAPSDADVAGLRRDGWLPLIGTEPESETWAKWDGPWDGVVSISRHLIKQGVLTRLPWKLKELMGWQRLGRPVRKFQLADPQGGANGKS